MQLSERLASLGIRGAQLRAPLKPPVHHSTIVLRGLIMGKEMEIKFSQCTRWDCLYNVSSILGSKLFCFILTKCLGNLTNLYNHRFDSTDKILINMCQAECRLAHNQTEICVCWYDYIPFNFKTEQKLVSLIKSHLMICRHLYPSLFLFCYTINIYYKIYC